MNTMWTTVKEQFMAGETVCLPNVITESAQRESERDRNRETEKDRDTEIKR